MDAIRHVMATNALDNDHFGDGAKLDGISLIVQGVALLFAGVLGFAASGPILSIFAAAGSFFGIRLIRTRVREKQFEENKQLREEMLRDYSGFLEKQSNQTRYDEWQRILVEISESELTNPNQKILERKLSHRYNLHNHPMLEEILEIAKQGHKSASQQTPDKFSKDRPISPQRSGKEAEDNVAELLRNTSGVVDVKRNVRIGKFMTDFIVTNDKGELFCVEVKSSRKNQTIYENLISGEPKIVRSQIQSMISAGFPNLIIDAFRTEKINGHTRVFVAKLKPQKSKSEEE